MKKSLTVLALAAAMVFSLFVPASAANVRTVEAEITYRGISVVVDGREIVPCDEKGNPTEPFIMNDTTYLPVRAVANALGLGVEWIPSTSTIALTSGGERNYGSGEAASSAEQKTVEITYRGTKLTVDGELVPLVNAAGDAVEPFILDGTNYLPLRIVGEALGLKVGWDGATSTVTLGEKLPEDVWMPSAIHYSGGTVDGELSELMGLKYEYDPDGRLTGIRSDDETVALGCSYDENGNLSEMSFRVPGERNSYAWKYDEAGEAVAYYENGVCMEAYSCEVDENGRIIKEYITENGYEKVNEYTYDAEGRVTGEKLGDYSGLIFEYTYDRYGRVIKKFERDINFPEGGAEYSYSYDKMGNLTKLEQFNHYMGYQEYIREYSYDALGRLAEEVCTWYAPYGENNTMRTGSKNVYSYEYDQYGNVISYEESTYFNELYDGGVSFSLYELIRDTYTYDAEGQLIYARYYSEPPGDAFTEDEQYTYNYDSAGRLTEERYVYICGGDKLQETVYKYSYDAAGRLTYESFDDATLTNGSSFYRQSYSYNAKGDPTGSSYTDSDGNEVYEKYIYDGLGRMVSYTLTDNGSAAITSVQYNEYDLPVRTETVSHAANIRIVAEMEYVLLPQVDMNEFLEELVGQIENMF